MSNIQELYKLICNYNKENKTKYSLLLIADGEDDSTGLALVNEVDGNLSCVVKSVNRDFRCDRKVDNHHYIREWMRDNLGV